jgi:hypothetical protein
MYTSTLNRSTSIHHLRFWSRYFCLITVVLMPPRAPNKATKKRAAAGPWGTNKRAKGTASQPIHVDSQLPSPLPLPPPTNAFQALVSASQAPTFEARLRESRVEDSIVATPEASEHATAAASEAPEALEAEDDVDIEAFDAHLMDNHDGLDWSRLKKFQLPVTTYKYKKSWVYHHGYRVALRSNPRRIYWVCHYCYHHKFTDIGRGIYYTTGAISATLRHLAENKIGHNIVAPGKTAISTPAAGVYSALLAGKLPVSQAVANQLSGFNIQSFRLAAVGWLIENNHPLSEFESPAFRKLIALANPLAEDALWRSHNSVSHYVMRLYDYLKPLVVKELSRSISKIHLSFDGWTTKGGKKGFLGVVAHYVTADGKLRDLPIALPQLTGAHTGEKQAEIVLTILQQFDINPRTIGYFVLDNASNNDSTIRELGHLSKLDFDPVHRRLCCGPHTLNLIGQVLLWGKHGEAFNNDHASSDIAEETQLMKDWRRNGPLGVLLGVVNFIKTLQQYALFEKFQRIANWDLPAEEHKILEPVKPVVTRWNSYYLCFEHAVRLQSAVNAYANSHIERVRDETTYAVSKGNKMPEAQPWMRSTGLTADDWQVVTEYIDVLGPLKACTKRLEGRGGQGNFGAIAEIIPTFEYLLSELESRLQSYEDVAHDAHKDAPEDHLAINLRAVLLKAREYYNKFDLSPAYYAATILHPRYKTYCNTAWAQNPEWLELNNGNFQALWAQYRSLPEPRTQTRRPKSNNIDDAINSILDPGNTNHEDDEFDMWKRREPQVEAGSEHAQNPILYWVELRDRYPNLSKLAIDVLSIPASSCECERAFSELGDLLEPR